MITENMTDQDWLRHLFTDRYYGPRLLATQNGTVVSYIIEEAKREHLISSKLEQDRNKQSLAEFTPAV